MFTFFSFSLQTFGGKLNLMPRGRMENWAKYLISPLSNNLLLFVMNGKIRYQLEMLFSAGFQALQFRAHQFMFTVQA